MQNGTAVSAALGYVSVAAAGPDAFLPAAYTPTNLTLVAGQPVLLEAAQYNNGGNGYMAVSGWFNFIKMI